MKICFNNLEYSRIWHSWEVLPNVNPPFRTYHNITTPEASLNWKCFKKLFFFSFFKSPKSAAFMDIHKTNQNTAFQFQIKLLAGLNSLFQQCNWIQFCLFNYPKYKSNHLVTSLFFWLGLWYVLRWPFGSKGVVSCSAPTHEILSLKSNYDLSIFLGCFLLHWWQI